MLCPDPYLCRDGAVCRWLGPVAVQPLRRDPLRNEAGLGETPVDVVLNLGPLVVEHRRARDSKQLRGNADVVGPMAERKIEATWLGPLAQRPRAIDEPEGLRPELAATVMPDPLVIDPESLAETEPLREITGGPLACRAATAAFFAPRTPAEPMRAVVQLNTK